MPSTTDEPIVTITGDVVTLGPLSRDFVPVMARWMNDPGAQHRLGVEIPRPFTLQDEEKWFDTQVVGSDRVMFLIRERQTGVPIGTISLFDVKLKNRSCELGIMIGEQSARGKGFGTEATRLALDYAFTVLEMHSVHLRTAGFNLMGQRAYAKAGFREVGRLRESIWQFGRWWDMVLMDCLESEFDSSILKERVGPDQPS